jgi:hypothetical protein
LVDRERGRATPKAPAQGLNQDLGQILLVHPGDGGADEFGGFLLRGVVLDLELAPGASGFGWESAVMWRFPRGRAGSCRWWWCLVWEWAEAGWKLWSELSVRCRGCQIAPPPYLALKSAHFCPG